MGRKILVIHILWCGIVFPGCAERYVSQRSTEELIDLVGDRGQADRQQHVLRPQRRQPAAALEIQITPPVRPKALAVEPRTQVRPAQRHRERPTARPMQEFCDYLAGESWYCPGCPEVASASFGRVREIATWRTGRRAWIRVRRFTGCRID